MGNSDNMLSVLEGFMPPLAEDVGRKMAEDFRTRRVEKNMTREEVSQKSGVALSNIVRFERKGLISLKNLIELSIVMGYTTELENLFSTPKYSTMEELLQIRDNKGKKKAYRR